MNVLLRTSATLVRTVLPFGTQQPQLMINACSACAQAQRNRRIRPQPSACLSLPSNSSRLFHSSPSCHGKSKKKEEQAFYDRVRAFVKGGTGGQGCARYGAVGGEGGDVIVQVDTTLGSLKHVAEAKRFKAKGGEPGSARSSASKGENAYVKVPIGTVIYSETGQKIADLDMPDDTALVARGGEGGSPATNHRYSGLPGDRFHVVFELKSIADVGLVGFPNAGKSSLLRAMSTAKPKVADYPFTTIKPQVGKVVYEDSFRLAMADIPGLIEGAHRNYGMGLSFLRHIERTQCLLFVLDLTGFQLRMDSPKRSAFEALDLLCGELDHYQSDLRPTKPKIIAVNKMDQPNTQELLQEFQTQLRHSKRRKEFKDAPIVPISAATGQGLDTLAHELRKAVTGRAATQQQAADTCFEQFLFGEDPASVEYRRDAERVRHHG